MAFRPARNDFEPGRPLFRYRVGVPGPDYQPPSTTRLFLGFWWFVGYGTGLDRDTAQLVVYAHSAKEITDHWPAAFIIATKDSDVGLWNNHKRRSKETKR